MPIGVVAGVGFDVPWWVGFNIPINKSRSFSNPVPSNRNNRVNQWEYWAHFGFVFGPCVFLGKQKRPTRGWESHVILVYYIFGPILGSNIVKKRFEVIQGAPKN